MVDQLPALVSLKCRSSAITDEGLAYVAGAKKLRGLHLEDAKISDDGMKQLAGLTAIDDLNLLRAPITDEGIAVLKAMPKMRHFCAKAQFTPM